MNTGYNLQSKFLPNGFIVNAECPLINYPGQKRNTLTVSQFLIIFHANYVYAAQSSDAKYQHIKENGSSQIPSKSIEKHPN